MTPEGAARSRADFREVEVVAPNLNRRFSGVTATVITVVARQARDLRIAALGFHLPPNMPRIGWRDVLVRGWRRPADRPFRIWHARRNIEMLAGVLLRDVLRQPWRLVFTSAAQRRHSRYTKWLIGRMDAVIATSPGAASFLDVPATTIMHGVDLERFAPAADREAAWRATGLPGRYGIGAFGRIRHQKGTDLFVEAMCRLLPDHPDWTAIVIGLATPENAGYLKSLQERVRSAGLADRVRFLGELPAAEIPGWFARLAVHVAPQRWEGFGLTPLEAMASGGAVVASHAGVFPALVDHGRTGLLVETGDLDALTAACREVMSDPARTAEMGLAGRERAQADFSIDREAAAIGGVYERVWTMDSKSRI